MGEKHQYEDVELLAPAGDWECLRAAVENGTNAIYFGLQSGFNARARAHNFTVDELPEIMEFLHLRGVKGYVTINTLAFSDELPEVEPLARRVNDAQADAVLVQDLGVARLIHNACPDLSIHASTQMTLSSAECIEAARELGIERVVLPRELSIDEISVIHQNTSMSLEAFVHGALCVSYSGQCLTSESLGGRSANRGQCAQACRLPYQVVCDDKLVNLGDVQYVLSPQDLAAYELVPRMLAAGVRCFKIEGRLKTPEYVANMTRQYRLAIDGAVKGQPVSFTRQQIREMELSFSRGFSPGWLEGCDHKQLVPGISSSKRGTILGTVVECQGKWITIKLKAPVKAGDGVVFEGDRFRDEEQGGRIIEVRVNGKRVEKEVEGGRVDISFHRTSIDLDLIDDGQTIWKTDDPALTQRLRKTFQSADPIQRVPLDLKVTAIVGEPVRIAAHADNGATCQVESDGPLSVAQKHVADEELLKTQLSRLGGSVYELRDLCAVIDGGPMIPLSVLGALRRELVPALNASLPHVNSTSLLAPLADMRASIQQKIERSEEPEIDLPEIEHATCHVLCRSLNQLDALLKQGVPRVVYADFQDIREYRDAIAKAADSPCELFVAPPRIQKPTEAGILKTIAKWEPTGVLGRNLATLDYFRDLTDVVADYSLNVTNELTAEFIDSLGVERMTASYDLNPDQLFDLVAAIPPGWLEVVVHQHMPMFHMEHCVFCAVLSPGTDKTNCGRPCDFHTVTLKDRIGKEHPLVADVGCRNTLFNATPQSGANHIRRLLRTGIQNFRVELLSQTEDETLGVIELYDQLLNDASMNADAVCKQLGADSRIRC